MASVCGATLALLDAGVPIAAPVAGVSIGTILGNTTTTKASDSVLITDILGLEDHYGDMDLKIAGSFKGITAVQMDVKQPIPIELLRKAVPRAKNGRMYILKEM